MGKHYGQLDLSERCSIAQLCKAGQSIRQIAAALDRSPSTVSRELRRNRGKQVGYKPDYAWQQARARRWTGSRLERDAELRALVLGQLQRGWSPEQIAGRLRQQNAARTISHESIYRFIYARSAAPTTEPGADTCQRADTSGAPAAGPGAPSIPL